MRASICLLLLLGSLAGCDGKPQAEPEPPPMKPEDTAFGDMTKAMDRAKGVEATTLERKQELDSALEEGEGGTR
jgi:hypothetical protein